MATLGSRLVRNWAWPELPRAELLLSGPSWSWARADCARGREKQLGARTREEKTTAPFVRLELGSSSLEVGEGRLSLSPLMQTGVSSEGDGKEEGGRKVEEEMG